MTPRLVGLLHYIAPQAPSSAHMRIIATFSDLEAFSRFGPSITGTKWRKWHEFAYPEGLTENEWERTTQRIWRLHRPLWQVWMGDLVAFYIFVRALVRRWA